MKFLRKKIQAPDAFKSMKSKIGSTLVGNAQKPIIVNRTHVKWLRTDGGGECVFNTLDGWLSDQ